jgi:hypothetical protein
MAQPVYILAHPVDPVWSTEPAIDFIDIPYEVGCPLFTDIVSQSATHAGRQGQLAVTKSPGPTEATDQIAGVTGNTTAVPVTRRALAAINIPPFLNEQNFQIRGFNQLQGSKDACRTTTNNDNVVFH